MGDVDHRREAERGRRAEALLADEVLGEAFRACEQKFYQEWLRTDDEKKQRAAWAMTHALDAVRQELHRAVNRGEHARVVLQSQQ